MNQLITLLSLLFVAPSILVAQEGREKIPIRYGIEADIDKYPQATPKDALRSVVKAIDAKRFDYTLAHLVEPTFVDKRVNDSKDKFEDVVKEVARKYEDDPETIRQLRKFLSDGEFPDPQGSDMVEVKCSEVKGKHLFLKKVGARWFLIDRANPEKAKEREKEPEKEKQKDPADDQ
jgi:hypothetical protein